MNSLLSKGLLIAGILLLAFWAAVPPSEKVNLGLDLQGGMHLVMQVDTEKALEVETDNTISQIEQELEDRGITASVERTGITGFDLVGIQADRFAELEEEVIERFFTGWNAAGNASRLSLSLSAEEAADIRRLSVAQAQETIRNRVDAFGVGEPVIHDEGLGSDRVVVQLPGVDDPERVKETIQDTAFLELRLVVEGTGPAPTEDAALAQVAPGDLAAVEAFSEPLYDDEKNEIGEQWWILERKRVVSGNDMRTARLSTDEFNQPAVSFMLTKDGGEKFSEVTGASIGRGLSIVLDNRIISVANIESRIGDSGIIRGNFTVQEVQDLVTKLRSGALPAPMTILEERTVGPSLGRDSIDQGRRAGMIGGTLVIVTMLVVYKLAGINAVLALLLNVVLVFGALSALNATLTLPGIAGIVLTIGMAVDANVLIFERIREELRLGKTVKMAISAGFEKALSSILDANFTTGIAAMFLFVLGTGPIKGFAVTLSIGIVASIFTAVFISRWLFDVIYTRRQRVDKMSI